MKLNTHQPSEAFAELESGLIVPSDYAIASPPMPKGMDFFAGAGGMSCGFHQAGWHMVAASEWDFHAAWTYLVNLGSPETIIHFASDEDKARWEKMAAKNKVTPDIFGTGWIGTRCDHDVEHCPRSSPKEMQDENPEKTRVWFHQTYCGGGADLDGLLPCEHFFFGDIRKLKYEDVLEILEMEPGDLDCIAGGPPCQGFSTAGKRQVMDPRNSLVFEFCRMIVGIQPKTMIFENVPGIVNMVTPEGVNVMDAVCLYLARGGYGTYDALRRSLIGMPSAKGAIRRAGKDQREAKPKKATKSHQPQMEMAI